MEHNGGNRAFTFNRNEVNYFKNGTASHVLHASAILKLKQQIATLISIHHPF